MRKRGGKNCWRLYRPDLDESAQVLSQLGWNEKIQAAIQADRLARTMAKVQGLLAQRASAATGAPPSAPSAVLPSPELEATMAQLRALLGAPGVGTAPAAAPAAAGVMK